MTNNSSRQFTTADDIFAALDKTRERVVTDMVTCEDCGRTFPASLADHHARTCTPCGK